MRCFKNLSRPNHCYGLFFVMAIFITLTTIIAPPTNATTQAQLDKMNQFIKPQIEQTIQQMIKQGKWTKAQQFLDRQQAMHPHNDFTLQEITDYRQQVRQQQQQQRIKKHIKQAVQRGDMDQFNRLINGSAKQAGLVFSSSQLANYRRQIRKQQQQQRIQLDQALKRGRVKAGNIGSEIPFNNDFFKLNAQGNPLPKSARQWACVADRTTGLIWEVKTNDGSVRDGSKEFRWGGRGVSNTAYGDKINNGNRREAERWDGEGERYDDWNALLDAVNGGKLCGYSDWRVPTLYELATLVQCKGGRYKYLSGGCEGSYKKPTINTEYFPNVADLEYPYYWSSSPYANGSTYAWLVGFDDGDDGSYSRYYDGPVRLVRFSQ